MGPTTVARTFGMDGVPMARRTGESGARSSTRIISIGEAA